jgi:ferritin-like metal-binding protein YciE
MKKEYQRILDQDQEHIDRLDEIINKFLEKQKGKNCDKYDQEILRTVRGLKRVLINHKKVFEKSITGYSEKEISQILKRWEIKFFKKGQR